MLEFSKISEDDNEVVYRYLVEGEPEHAGVVSIDKLSGECRFVSIPEEDEHKSYALHMFSMMRKSLKANDFKESGLIMWY